MPSLLNQRRILNHDADSFFSNVSLLMGFSGENGSTNFLDSSRYGHTITPSGDSQISTDQSVHGGTSGKFDGTGDYLTAPSHEMFAFGTGDATIEAIFYPNTVSGTQILIDFRVANGVGPALYLSGSTLSVARDTGTVLQSGGTVVANRWNYVAWTREGSTNRLFLNGLITSTVTNSANYPQSSAKIAASNLNTQFFNGYIEELRITKGVARYVANYTIPTQPFPRG